MMPSDSEVTLAEDSEHEPHASPNKEMDVEKDPRNVNEGANSGRNTDGPITVVFEPGDPDDPRNWSLIKKAWIVLLSIFLTLNSTLSSSMPSGSISFISTHFNVTDENQLVLPISVFLIGYIVGPLFLAPLSEVYGRRILLLGTFFLYILFTLGTALVNNFPGLLVLRLLAGTAASAPLAIVGAVYADIFESPVDRGRMMAIFGTGTTFGPACSPMISGFLGKVSWRWPFWFSVIFAGATLVPLWFWPETFAPILLARRAAKMRKELNRDDIIAEDDPANINLKEVFSVTLTRPVTMLFTEPIVGVVSLYLAYVYGILYLFFQGYPLIFKEVYGMGPGIEGLAYLPIGLGSVFSSITVILWDGHVRKKEAKEPDFKISSEYHRLTLAAIGGPLMVASLFWLGWTARKSIHWISPILAGLPFGMGCTIIFMSLISYLVDAYGIFSASALASGTWTRSVWGALLPMAGKPMYHSLGIAWANSLLGFIALGMVAIPFVFAKYGPSIRAKSPYCQKIANRDANNRAS
ncbi:hypothetical protein VTO42DRAFT_2673 [Malbranchea cinnamomea]